MLKTNKSIIIIIIIVVAIWLLTNSCFAIETRQDNSSSIHTLETNSDYTIIWTVPNIYEHSMVGAPGRIIVLGWKSGGITASRLFALDNTIGDIVWDISYPGGGEIITQQEILYIGTIGTARVRAHDTKTGDLLWDTRLPWAHSVDTINYAEKKIFVNTSDFEFFILSENGEILENFSESFTIYLQKENVLYMDSVIGIQAVNASSQEKIWELELGSSWSTPIFDGRTIFVSTRSKGGDILSIDQTTGEINWRVPQDVLSNLYVTNGKIFFISSSGHLITLDRYSGQEISRVKFFPSFDMNEQIGKYLVTGDPTSNMLAISFGDNAQIMGLKIMNP